jgi:hypothetical protein
LIQQGHKKEFDMQEVVKKIGELVSLLEVKIAYNDQKSKELLESQKEVEKKDGILVATEKNLKAKERIISKYEDFEVERNSVLGKEKMVEAQRIALESSLKGIEVKDAELQAKEKLLQTSIDAFAKKDLKIDEMKVALEEEKKVIKDKVIEEIKGKL